MVVIIGHISYVSFEISHISLLACLEATGLPSGSLRSLLIKSLILTPPRASAPEGKGKLLVATNVNDHWASQWPQNNRAMTYEQFQMTYDQFSDLMPFFLTCRVSVSLSFLTCRSQDFPLNFVAPKIAAQ